VGACAHAHSAGPHTNGQRPLVCGQANTRRPKQHQTPVQSGLSRAPISLQWASNGPTWTRRRPQPPKNLPSHGQTALKKSGGRWNLLRRPESTSAVVASAANNCWCRMIDRSPSTWRLPPSATSQSAARKNRLAKGPRRAAPLDSKQRLALGGRALAGIELIKPPHWLVCAVWPTTQHSTGPLEG